MLRLQVVTDARSAYSLILSVITVWLLATSQQPAISSHSYFGPDSNRLNGSAFGNVNDGVGHSRR